MPLSAPPIRFGWTQSFGNTFACLSLRSKDVAVCRRYVLQIRLFPDYEALALVVVFAPMLHSVLTPQPGGWS